jgi:hypothetical protein
VISVDRRGVKNESKDQIRCLRYERKKKEINHMKTKDPPDVIMGAHERKKGDDDCVRIKMNWVWGEE